MKSKIIYFTGQTDVIL